MIVYILKYKRILFNNKYIYFPEKKINYNKKKNFLI